MLTKVMIQYYYDVMHYYFTCSKLRIKAPNYPIVLPYSGKFCIGANFCMIDQNNLRIIFFVVFVLLCVAQHAMLHRSG